MNEPLKTLAPARIRFRNGKTAGLVMAAVLVGVLTLGQRRDLVGYFADLFVLYGLQASFFLFMGVVLDGGDIIFPRAPFFSLPFLVFGRKRRAIGELEDVTYVGSTLGIEHLNLRFVDERRPALFSSRGRRVAFFEAIQAKKHNIRIYRA
jgi:hypothetical protein